MTPDRSAGRACRRARSRSEVGAAEHVELCDAEDVSCHGHTSVALHEQPRLLWHCFERLTQLFPHAWPASQILQHLSAGMQAGGAAMAVTSDAAASCVKHASSRARTDTSTAKARIREGPKPLSLRQKASRPRGQRTGGVDGDPRGCDAAKRPSDEILRPASAPDSASRADLRCAQGTGGLARAARRLGVTGSRRDRREDARSSEACCAIQSSPTRNGTKVLATLPSGSTEQMTHLRERFPPARTASR